MKKEAAHKVEKKKKKKEKGSEERGRLTWDTTSLGFKAVREEKVMHR